MGITVTAKATATILIVEDDSSIRDNLSILLEEEGYNVITAADGLTGINKACEFLPNLIICDIMMPKLNGYGLVAALRFDQETSSIPIIFLTAKNDKMDIGYGMLLGAVDYITKPYLNNELLNSIEYNLTHSDARPPQMEDANLLFPPPNQTQQKPKKPGRRLTFLEKVERAVSVSPADSVEKKVFLNQPVSVGEIKQRVKVLWQKYDENPSGPAGLIAVWLETRLS